MLVADFFLMLSKMRNTSIFFGVRRSEFAKMGVAIFVPYCFFMNENYAIIYSRKAVSRKKFGC